nr:hypothetical protein [Microbacterium bovistercoris]
MSREGALLIVVAIAIVAIGLMAWGWWRRTRRDAALTAPHDTLPADATFAAYNGLYVATTAHDQPLERLAIRGLGLRSKAVIRVGEAGVALEMPGQDTIALSAARLVDVGRATVAIDRVVEHDGLTRLSWRTDAGPVVDSYLRPQDASATALTEAIRPLITTPETGSAA